MQGSLGKNRRRIIVRINSRIGRNMIRIIIIRTILVTRGVTKILEMTFKILTRNRYFFYFSIFLFFLFGY